LPPQREIAGGEQVLEIGTGYGYQAALLARLAARVVSIQIWPRLAAQARRNLAAQAITNVLVVAGDGTEGYPGRCSLWRGHGLGGIHPGCRPRWLPSCAPVGAWSSPSGREATRRFSYSGRQAESLEPLTVLTIASFVSLYGKHGFALRKRDH
jgi:protein-L-isoaspartate(D-aspartate) O-methyltransferase